jgi:hypothetical protein
LIDDLESKKPGLKKRYKIIKIPGGVEVMTVRNFNSKNIVTKI